MVRLSIQFFFGMTEERLQLRMPGGATGEVAEDHPAKCEHTESGPPGVYLCQSGSDYRSMYRSSHEVDRPARHEAAVLHRGARCRGSGNQRRDWVTLPLRCGRSRNIVCDAGSAASQLQGPRNERASHRVPVTARRLLLQSLLPLSQQLNAERRSGELMSPPLPSACVAV